MLKAVDLSGRSFHFIGVGGIGMSALAHILADRQLPVSGSDVRSTHITQKLSELGARIFLQQSASNLESFLYAPLKNQSAQSNTLEHQPSVTSGQTSPQVICSTAIRETNPEYQAAQHLGCPIFHRSDVLAALLGESAKSIAVAGTHGKTTTSSLIGYMLLESGLDPTIIVGGEVAAWKGNARSGNSDYLVAEADESDGSLVKFQSRWGVITNIELDHPDHYASIEEVVDIFLAFVHHCQHLVVSYDCPTIRSHILSQALGDKLTTYSLNIDAPADYRVDRAYLGADRTEALVYEGETLLGELRLNLLGQHNLSNALAAVAIGRQCGLDFNEIARALSSFMGTARRFERRGEVNNICLVDDYAHHPSEIAVTLAAARLQASSESNEPAMFERVIAVFQPHRYSRMLAFLEEFSQSFGDADLVITTDIYGAGEPKLDHLSGSTVAEAIAQHHDQVCYQPTLDAVSNYLKQILQPGDLVMFLGAGDINKIIPDLLAYLQQGSSERQTTEVVLR